MQGMLCTCECLFFLNESLTVCNVHWIGPLSKARVRGVRVCVTENNGSPAVRQNGWLSSLISTGGETDVSGRSAQPGHPCGVRGLELPDPRQSAPGWALEALMPPIYQILKWTAAFSASE